MKAQDANLNAGDVLTYTIGIYQKYGNVAERTYTMNVVEVKKELVYGINVKTGKPCNVELEYVRRYAVARKVAA